MPSELRATDADSDSRDTGANDATSIMDKRLHAVNLPLFSENFQYAAEKFEILRDVPAEVVRVPPEVKNAAVFRRRANPAGDAPQTDRLKAFSLRRVGTEKHAGSHIVYTAGLRDFFPTNEFWSRQRDVAVKQAWSAHG